MRSLRSKIGHLLREAGVIPDAFTPSQIEQIREVIAEHAAKAAPEFTAVADNYAAGAPSAQLAVDIFAGEWSSRLPAELGVTSGVARLFEDSRMERTIEWMGTSAVGARVLELGPLEGGHTYMFDQAGAEVLAIESNSRAYLKCLITKELLGMKRARFARGDFTAFLKHNDDTFDLVVASGVLYHMVNPTELLQLMAARSNRLAIWTHYYDEILLRSPMARQFTADPVRIEFEDTTYRLHPREYLEALAWGGFCGGPEAYARWMERTDILDCLGRLGFDEIEIGHDDKDHQNGPSFLLLAERRGPA